MANVTVDRRLWLTADRESLVEDGDPEAAFLWAIAGRAVPQAEADRVGYQARPADPEPEEESTPEESQSEVEAETSEVESDPEPEPQPKRKPGRPKGSKTKKTGD